MTSRHDSSGMGLLSANSSLNLPSSLGRMNPGSTSKFSHQGSHGMRSPNSSQGLPPIFGHGNRPASPSSPRQRINPDETSEVLASFGLSSRDLVELSRYPAEKITPKNLPQIILDIKRKRSEDMALKNLREGPSREPLRVSSDDTRPFRRDHFNDRSPGLDKVVDFGRGSRSEDADYRDRLVFEGRLRERERLREERFRYDASYHKVDDYKRMGFSRSQERSMHEKIRGMPSNRNIDDFHGVPPKGFPYLCSLCDIEIISHQNWDDHVQGRAHCRQRLQLLEIYPDWTGPVLDDSHTLRRPKIVPARMRVGGGPIRRSGGQMGYLGAGTGGMPGPNLMKKGKVPSRVVLIKGFEKGKRLKFELLKLAESFGVISNFLIISKKNEALIEMSTPEEATAVKDYYRTHPAIVNGKRVGVHISQKFKFIKKPDWKADNKPNARPEFGSVVHLTNLPSSRFSDTAVTMLAEAYGKVKTYILMKLRNQAFIEMEKPEDATTMVEQCAKIPLMFKGNRVNVEICSRYKHLVLKFPNKNLKQLQKDKNRKKSTQNAESGDGENTSPMVATEDDCQDETEPKDSVTDACEPAVEDEDETAALMKTSSSTGDGAKVADTSDIDMKDEETAEAEGPNASTPIAKVTADKKKKPDGKADQKPKLKPGFGRILHFSNLPTFGYTDAAFMKLGKACGKVITYRIMRVKHQGYIEMEKPEDANTMVQRCAKRPLWFYGKRLKVDICKQFESLSLKFPSMNLQQLRIEYNRKRPRSPDSKDGAKQKQRKTETSKGKRKMAHDYPGDIEEFVTVDDCDDEEAEQENKADAQQEPESADSPMTPENATETECPKDLGPFKPNNPVGVDYVVPAFFCTLCSFYTCEDVAKVKHCSKLSHYNKLKKAMKETSKVPEKKN
ncbi:matrin-3-like isoform X2 [Pseudophryne corroboree]|uniref:matrin-3-like isoform X2 n=1 Tax=Pseudophryne corroboree TaxID=495146 RepID=UPI00308161DB